MTSKCFIENEISKLQNKKLEISLYENVQAHEVMNETIVETVTNIDGEVDIHFWNCNEETSGIYIKEMNIEEIDVINDSDEGYEFWMDNGNVVRVLMIE